MQIIPRLFWFIDHLALFGLILAAACFVGDLLLGRLRFGSRLERAIFTLATGLGCWALVLFGLGVCGLLYREAIWALTGLGAAGAGWRLWQQRKRIAAIRLTGLAGRIGWGGGCLAAVVLLYWLMLIVTALYPPMQWDATAYHLVMARQYLTEHQITPNLGVNWPVLPLLNQMLFAWGMAIRDDILAQLIEHTFLMLPALGLYAWGRSRQQPLPGATMAAFWLSHPLVLWLGSAAYVDICLAAFAFLGIYALRLAWEGGDARFWRLGMALLGMAAGAKSTGLGLPVFGLIAGLIAWKTARLSFAELTRAAAAAFIFGAPWYLLIGYFTGNPVWPALASYSRAEWSHPELLKILAQWTTPGVAKTPLNYLAMPVLLILRPLKFLPDGLLTLMPVMAIFPLAWIVSWWNRSVRWWTLWASAIMLGWFATSQQVRLLLPMLPVAGAAIIESLEMVLARLRVPVRGRRLVWAGMIAVFLAWGVSACWREFKIKQIVPTSTAERERWLSDRTIGYRAARFINQRAEPVEKVYLINASWLSYHVEADTISHESMLQLQNWPSSQSLDAQWAAYFKERGIDWVLIRIPGNVSMVPHLPADISRENPLNPDYRLAYRDVATLVFRKAQN